jgi:hypothetical protein
VSAAGWCLLVLVLIMVLSYSSQQHGVLKTIDKPGSFRLSVSFQTKLLRLGVGLNDALESSTSTLEYTVE